jgi:serine/threonine protein kinase
LLQCLGVGHYGEVWLGYLLSESGNDQETVAIKMPKQFCILTEDGEDELKSERKSIRNELNILLHIGKHENVLELKGAVTLMKDHFWMALEYCELGSLDKFLAGKKKNQLFVDEIVQHADEISGTIFKVHNNRTHYKNIDPLPYSFE